MNLVTLYYNFKDILHPETFCFTHKKKCQDLNLVGRVYIAGEGINGTLSGKKQDIIAYQEYLRSIPTFEDTEFKDDVYETIPFVKLIVKTRDEIVSLKSSLELKPQNEHCPHLSPQQWREALESNEEYTLLDVRNRYESKIGHFEGAICPDVENFFDFPQWLEQAKLDKDRKVLMYCTGGIRCEKFSLFMQKEGFKDIAQLKGGIINYSKRIGDAHYKGKCFVFDDRLSVSIERNQKEPISKCEITGIPCDHYMNCANYECNKLFICSEEGANKMEGCCSEACYHTHTKRPFDADNIYTPTKKWYHYYNEKKEMWADA